MESSAAKPTPPRHHRTIVSPTLERDILRLKRLAPFLSIFPMGAAAYLLALFASGLVMGPQEAWTKLYAPARLYGLSPQTVSFHSADGIPLKAWWERSWSVPAPKCTVILVHGSQSNKSGLAYTAALLLTQGFSVLLVDLRAHGESGGEYCTFGYKEALDVEAAVRWTKANVGGRIALLGHSSGAVAALLAASRTPDLAAVIADSAFLDTREVFRRENYYLGHLPPNSGVPWKHRMRLFFFTAPGFSWLSREAFRLRTGVPFDPPEASVRAAVSRIKRTPVLYLAAAQDPIVPRAVTEELYGATASPGKRLSIQPGAFHGAIGGDPSGYMAAVTEFLDSVLGTQPVFVPESPGR